MNQSGDQLPKNGQRANSIALRLQKYFDPFYLTQTNLSTDRTPPPELEKIIKKYQLSADEITCIYGLVRWRASINDERYNDKEKQSAEIEMLYNLVQRGIKSPDDPLNFPIGRITVEMKDGTPYTISNPINLINLVTHAWPYFKAFMEREFQQYIKPQYAPRSSRKRKGADTGKLKACKQLGVQILRYLNDNAQNLHGKEKGDVIRSMFLIAGYRLPYTTGKNAYDSLDRAMSKE